ncbi:hypothetical protein CASFOL_033685 [Castilleja foliolosa]|uniref:Uncharacterized protein n=1 Tax=Castilleja foliolosa TaxID=1961234 RepID=A0ABD3BY97_9LAMI
MSERSGQASKMSKRIARSISPTEMTDSKRRSTLTEPIEALYPSRGMSLYHLGAVSYERSFGLLVAKILKSQSDFLAIAKLHMTYFLNFFEEIVPISVEAGNKLLCGVWLNPGFIHPLAAALDYKKNLIGSVMLYSNQDSVSDRITHMEADPYFKLAMMDLKKPISTSTFVRLFVSILIGYWGDKGLLRVLDQIMGKNIFGWQLDLSAEMKATATEHAGEKVEIERFSFVIEDIGNVKDMEPLRQLLVERYGPREDVDVEAILEEVYPNTCNLLRITHNYISKDKKAVIYVSVVNGRHYGALYLRTIRSKKAC